MVISGISNEEESSWSVLELILKRVDLLSEILALYVDRSKWVRILFAFDWFISLLSRYPSISQVIWYFKLYQIKIEIIYVLTYLWLLY